MKCFPLLIAILACLGVLMVSLLMAVMIKHRKKICHWWKRHAIWMFIVNVLLPFMIPMALAVIPLVVKENNGGCPCHNITTDELVTTGVFVLVGLAIINMIFQCILWIKDKKEADIRWENAAARCAYNNLFRVIMEKNANLKTSYHRGLTHGMLTDADIPYDVFSQIRTICMQLCDTISEITKIEKKDLSASFIYHYCYIDATDNDKRWRWLTGKGAKFDLALGSFVDRPGSTFHHMIHDGVASTFYNDKKKAEADGRYIFSYRDNSHNRIGSLFAVKVAFSGNDGILCEGVIMIDSYGYKFLDNMPRQTEENLKELILDRIMPVYRQAFQTELAMLYFRHETEPNDECFCECPKKSLSPSEIHCEIGCNKTTWNAGESAKDTCREIKKVICRKRNKNE